MAAGAAGAARAAGAAGATVALGTAVTAAPAIRLALPLLANPPGLSIDRSEWPGGSYAPNRGASTRQRPLKRGSAGGRGGGVISSDCSEIISAAGGGCSQQCSSQSTVIKVIKRQGSKVGRANLGLGLTLRATQAILAVRAVLSVGFGTIRARDRTLVGFRAQSTW